MASVKPKLQGYVREDLFIQFEDERRSLGLSQSQALEKMLLERYRLEPSKPNPESLCWITKSLEDLQARVKRLEITGNPESDSLSNLESDSPSNLESNPKSNPPSNLESDSLSNPLSNLESDSPSNLESNPKSNPKSNPPSNLESDSLSNPLSNLESDSLSNPLSNLESDSPSNLESNPESDSLSNLESDSPSNLESNPESDSLSNLESNPLDKLASESKLAKGLGQRALAKRLGCTYQWLTDKVILGGLDSWSKGEDPQGLSWELRGGKFYPCNLVTNKSAS
jgi:hypothetical protein